MQPPRHPKQCGPEVTEDAKTALIIRGARPTSATLEQVLLGFIAQESVISHRGKHSNTWDSKQRHASIGTILLYSHIVYI